MSGVYWGLTAMDLMGQLHRMNRSEVIDFVKSCQHPTLGGFSPTLHHDPHLLYTLSAIQVCVYVYVCGVGGRDDFCWAREGAQK